MRDELRDSKEERRGEEHWEGGGIRGRAIVVGAVKRGMWMWDGTGRRGDGTGISGHDEVCLVSILICACNAPYICKAMVSDS